MAIASFGVLRIARRARTHYRSRVAMASCLLSLLAAAVHAQTPVTPQPPAQPPAQPPVRPAPAPRDTAPAAPAQPRDSAPQAPAPAAATPDSARAGAPRTRAAAAPQTPQPPISPKRALLYSLLVPGLGQSRLERQTAGALFVAIEVSVLTMMRKSQLDLQDAKRFRADSVITSYPIDPATGQPTAPPRDIGYYNEALIRSRRLHYEDWVALLLFNHVFAGAEAFVAANLWDLPTQVSARPLDGGRGAALAVRVTW